MGFPTPLQRLDPNNWNNNHRAALLHLALKKLHDYHAAEDLVQETFIAAWKSRDRFRGQCSEKSFLCSILKNKLIDFYRRQARRPALIEQRLPSDTMESPRLDSMADEKGGGMDPRLYVMRAHFRIELEAAVAKLPEKLRLAYQLGQMADLPALEAASRLGISENNLWLCIHRARKLLRAELGSRWSAESLAATN